MTRTQRQPRRRSTRLALGVLGLALCPFSPAQAIPVAATDAYEAGISAAVVERPRSGCLRDRVVLIAHRGTGDGTRTIDGRRYSEDTVPAFVKALREGADGFEADYWPTADGRIATHHDDTLDRMTDGTGRIAEHPWSHLRTLRHDSGAPLSTFDAVELATRPLGGHRQHEIKEGVGFSDRHLRHMLAMDVRNVPNAYDRVLYTSSEVETLRRITAVDPRIRVGLITRSDRGRPSLRRLPAWVDVILVDLRAADADYVRRARAAGFEVSMRRVQSAAELHRAAALGATRVVTDRPEELGHAC